LASLFKGVKNYIDNHFGHSSGDEEFVNTNDVEDIDDIVEENFEENICEDNIKKGIRIKDGKFEVKGSGNIIPCRGIELYINDEKCMYLKTYSVNEADKIEYNIIKDEEIRKVFTDISKDKMKAFINIQYKGNGDLILKDCDWSENLYLQCESLGQDSNSIEKYNFFDIKDILNKNNIVKGIDESKIREACEKGTNGQNIEIAKGVMPVDDIPSSLKILFDVGGKDLKAETKEEKIDYKNVYSIVNVQAGEVLAEIIPRIDGTNGYNVCGEELKRRFEKNRPIKIGDGCKIENDKIIATQNGRPSSKNGIISVNEVYKVKNVDLKSGNIKFIGDIEVEQGVNEGMTVNAGNSVFINKDVDNATISAGGEINIKGNIIKSKVTTGQIDLEKKLYLDNLKKLKNDISNLIGCSEELFERTNTNMSFPEVVKVLIENKFRSVSKLTFSIVSQSVNLEIEEHEIIKFLKSKFIGANISSIREQSQLLDFLDLIDNEIDFYEDDMIIQSDINISYCQDSLIKSTGKIQITGKGTYVSDIIALNEVEFIRKDAVARGGKISSMKFVVLGTVGSPAGVRTIVEVPENGVITAEVAYTNTQFCFGKKSKIIESDCRNVKAYVDELGDIQIEKLKL